jgi:hypothetical protein
MDFSAGDRAKAALEGGNKIHQYVYSGIGGGGGGGISQLTGSQSNFTMTTPNGPDHSQFFLFFLQTVIGNLKCFLGAGSFMWE